MMISHTLTIAMMKTPSDMIVIMIKMSYLDYNEDQDNDYEEYE